MSNISRPFYIPCPRKSKTTKKQKSVNSSIPLTTHSIALRSCILGFTFYPVSVSLPFLSAVQHSAQYTVNFIQSATSIPNIAFGGVADKSRHKIASRMATRAMISRAGKLSLKAVS